jgi:hypothetical protein
MAHAGSPFLSIPCLSGFLFLLFHTGHALPRLKIRQLDTRDDLVSWEGNLQVRHGWVFRRFWVLVLSDTPPFRALE